MPIMLVNRPPSHIAKRIQRAVTDVAENKLARKNAVFRVEMINGDSNLVVARKWIRGWKVEAWIGERWSTPIVGGVSVYVSW